MVHSCGPAASLDLVLSRTTLLVWLLVLAGCAVGERPILTDESIDGVPGGAEASTIDESVEPVESASPLAARRGGPAAVISPTGVLLPVLDIRDGNYVVLSPCGVEAELAWGQAIREVTVVLDPGHGGVDEKGALGPSGETEAELNLDIARRTATLLEAQDVTVALTRTGDYRIPVANRAAIADLLEAEAFVSIHHNSPTPALSDTPGTEVYVQNDSADSSRLGGLLYEETISALGIFDVEWSSRPDAGVLVVLSSDGDDAFGINRRPVTPAALVELAYLSNPSEALVLATGEYRQAAAVGLANAIIRYLESDDPGSGFIDEKRLFDPSAETGGVEGCVDPDLG